MFLYPSSGLLVVSAKFAQVITKGHYIYFNFFFFFRKRGGDTKVGREVDKIWKELDWENKNKIIKHII